MTSARISAATVSNLVRVVDNPQLKALMFPSLNTTQQLFSPTIPCFRPQLSTKMASPSPCSGAFASVRVWRIGCPVLSSSIPRAWCRVLNALERRAPKFLCRASKNAYIRSPLAADLGVGRHSCSHWVRSLCRPDHATRSSSSDGLSISRKVLAPDAAAARQGIGHAGSFPA